MKNRRLHSVPRIMGPVPEPQVIRGDGWMNEVSGIGGMYDKGEYTKFELNDRDVKLLTANLEQLYYSDDLIARMCDIMAEECFRRGFVVEHSDDIELAEKLNKYHKKLDTAAIFMKALKFANVFGTALIIIGADDGASIDELKNPINEDKIRTVKYLTVVYGNYVRPAYLQANAASTQVAGYFSNPTEPKYGTIQTWSISTPFGSQVFDVDESRVIVLDATTVTEIRRMQNAGLADSLIQRAWPILGQVNIAYKGLSTLLAENGLGIWKLQDLASMIARDPNELMRRMRLSDSYKSITRSIVIDTTEDFQRSYAALQGLKDTFEVLMGRLSAALRIPQTLLFGRSPSGMNSTGESDMRLWYDRVRSKQTNELTPALMKITRLCALAQDSEVGDFEDDGWEITWPELHQATEAEQASIEVQKAQAVSTYITAGVVTPEEVARAAFGPDGYSTLLKIDLDEHQELVDEERQAKEEEATAQHAKELALVQAKVGQKGKAPVDKERETETE